MIRWIACLRTRRSNKEIFVHRWTLALQTKISKSSLQFNTREKGNGQKPREPSKLLVRCRILQRVGVKFLVSLFVRLFYVIFELRKVENKDVGNSAQDSTFATIVYWNRELNLSKNGLYSSYNPLFISSQRKKSKYMHNIHIMNTYRTLHHKL